MAILIIGLILIVAAGVVYLIVKDGKNIETEVVTVFNKDKEAVEASINNLDVKVKGEITADVVKAKQFIIVTEDDIKADEAKISEGIQKAVKNVETEVANADKAIVADVNTVESEVKKVL